MRVGHRRRRARPAPRRERGSVIFMVAISLSVLVTCTALTVDLGRVSTLGRDLQNVADAAAVDLVRQVDGRTAGEIVADPRWNGTLQAALARNGFVVGGARTVTARLGGYDAAADVFTPVAGAGQVPTAVSVTVTDRSQNQFAPGGIDANRKAVAAQTAAAGIQVGSFAARLGSQDSALLGPLLGDALGVDVIGYRGLAGGRVGIDALATELGLSLGSPEELLTTELDLAELVAAQAAVLRRGGDVARASILEALEATLPSSLPPVTLGDLLVLGSGGAAAAADATLDVLEVLTTAAMVSNGSNALSIPGLSLGVPGVVATNVGVQVVESPRIGFGGPGTTVKTAQVRLTARLDLTAVGLVGAHLDLSVDVAPAAVTIRDIACGAPQQLGLDVTTGLVDTRLALDTKIAVALLGLVDIPVATVGATAHTANPAGAGQLDLAFPPDVLGEPRPYSSRSLGLSGLTLTPKLELLPTAQLPLLFRTVLGLVTSTAATVVGTVLVPLVAAAVGALDAVLVQPLLSLLGVTVPGADVTPLSVRCTGPRLVS